MKEQNYAQTWFDPFTPLPFTLYTIQGPNGPVSYRGPMKDYVLGTGSFMDFPAGWISARCRPPLAGLARSA